MGGGGGRSGNIRDYLPGGQLGQAKTYNNGQAGNRETSEVRRQTNQAIEVL